MARCRFPAMKVDRLMLSDVYVARLKRLRDEGVTQGRKKRAATKSELSDAERALAQAKEDGAWIDVKHELTAGEANKASARAVKAFRSGEQVEFDPEQVVMARLVEYLVGWSFTDAEGQPVPFDAAMTEEDRTAVLLSVDEATFIELREAVEAHAEKVAAEKNAPAPGNG